jgi:hypothetical protein
VTVDPQSRVQALVDEALADLATDAPTSAILDKAIRVARLRGDGENLVWLTMETRGVGAEAAKKRVMTEARPYFATYEAMRAHWGDVVEEFITERTLEQVPTGKTEEGGSPLIVMSVRELEVHIEALREASSLGGDLNPSRAELLTRINQFRQVLARVRNRIQEYLSRVEREVIVGTMVSSIFEEQRAYVDARLREIAPSAFDQLAAAYKRRSEGFAESRAQALTSTRRALKSVADALYPPRPEPVVGADGVERTMTDGRYISRLLQYAYERTKGQTAGVLLGAQIEDLASKLEALNDLDSKGVHASVTAFETNQAIIQTYLTLGDLLRLADATPDESEG